MTDLQAAWVFDAFVLVVAALFDAVWMAFALHSALARSRVHRPELAGGRLIGLWIPSTAAWVGTAVALSALVPLCSRPDAALFWAGLFYPLAAWPAFYLAGRAGVRLSRSYPALQGVVILTLLLLGGGPCLV